MSEACYKVVVVEDEALIRRSVSKKIQNLDIGFDVIGEAMDGKSALDIIESKMPQLVITDICMPIMDGLELAKRVYYSYPNIKIVIISGYSEFGYAKQAIKYQVSDYLLKPVVNEELLSTLTKIKLVLDKDNDVNILSDLKSSKEDNSIENLGEAVEFYIRKNYRSDLNIEKIASELNFSPDYLSRVYKKLTGQSPLKYLISLRINEAKRLLTKEIDISIKKVGELVGYKDQYYFSRIFKNHTGYYPSEFRELKLENVKESYQ